VASREHSLTHPAWDGREADFLPLTSPAASDSANLDMLAEFLVSVVCRSSSLSDSDPNDCNRTSGLHVCDVWDANAAPLVKLLTC
jgi:Glutamine amidotransferases class-II